MVGRCREGGASARCLAAAAHAKQAHAGCRPGRGRAGQGGTGGLERQQAKLGWLAGCLAACVLVTCSCCCTAEPALSSGAWGRCPGGSRARPAGPPNRPAGEPPQPFTPEMARQQAYSSMLYRLPCSMLPMSMTGIILEDLASTCRQGQRRGQRRGQARVNQAIYRAGRGWACVLAGACWPAPLSVLLSLPLLQPPRQCCTLCCVTLHCRACPAVACAPI